MYKNIALFFFYKIFKLLNSKKFRVNCLVVGSQKAGTSAIIEMLSQHKQIITPKKNKELFFFSQYFNPENDYKKYHLNFVYNFFKKINFKNKFFVEKTPDYFLKKKYLTRIYKYNPNIKIILCLRNPYERILSSYLMFKKLGETERWRKNDSFYQSVRRNLKDKSINYLEYSLYYEKINHIYKIFPKNNVLLINYKELRNLSLMKKIFKFLDKQLKTEGMKLKKVHVSKKYKIPKRDILKTYKYLRRFIDKDLKKVKRKYNIKF